SELKPEPTQVQISILVPILHIPAVQKPQGLTGHSKTRSLVHRLFTYNPEDLQDATRPCLEESPETVRPLASNSSIRQTHPDTGSPRLWKSTARSKTEETLASMVPSHYAAARSRRRILRFNHIQPSRRDRTVNDSRLYARDNSCLCD